MPMPDILIRDIPAEDVALLDAQAKRAGLTRTEYLRRHLRAQARRTTGPVTAESLRSFATALPDLADPDIMRDAWS